jgi:hypothetical protein
MQQVELVNPFPVGFTFDFVGNAHQLKPYGRFNLLQDVSRGPVKIRLIEDGWPDFPVALAAPTREENAKSVVNVDFGASELVVGLPYRVTVDPPATPLNEGDGDWIIVSISGDATQFIFIPAHRGRLALPRFTAGNCAFSANPASMDAVDRLVPTWSSF